MRPQGCNYANCGKIAFAYPTGKQRRKLRDVCKYTMAFIGSVLQVNAQSLFNLKAISKTRTKLENANCCNLYVFCCIVAYISSFPTEPVFQLCNTCFAAICIDCIHAQTTYNFVCPYPGSVDRCPQATKRKNTRARANTAYFRAADTVACQSPLSL